MYIVQAALTQWQSSRSQDCEATGRSPAEPGASISWSPASASSPSALECVNIQECIWRNRRPNGYGQVKRIWFDILSSSGQGARSGSEGPRTKDQVLDLGYTLNLVCDYHHHHSPPLNFFLGSKWLQTITVCQCLFRTKCWTKHHILSQYKAWDVPTTQVRFKLCDKVSPCLVIPVL